MGYATKIRNALILPFSIIFLTSASCQQLGLFEEPTPFPTYTAYPTFTPYPTQTPQPTFTPAPSLTSTPEIVIEEDFEDGGSCFEEIYATNVEFRQGNGKFVMDIMQTDLSIWSICRTRLPNNISFQADITLPKNIDGEFSAGLMIRESGGQWIEFAISPSTNERIDNLFALGFRGIEKYISLIHSVKWVEYVELPSRYDLQGTNTMRIEVIGDSYSIYFNEEHLATILEDTLSGGKVGFIINNFTSPDVHVEFDNVIITELDK